MSQNTLDGDLYVRGLLKADSMILPANGVGDTQVTPAAPLGRTKTKHLHNRLHTQGKGASVVSKTGEPIHIAFAAGTLVQVEAAVSVAPLTTATVTIDVKKNGVTVLSGTILLDNTTVAYTPVLGTISVPAYVAGDFFDVVVTVAGGGTPPQGLAVLAVFEEGAS